MNRRQFLLGASALVAGAVLPANAVRESKLEWIGIDSIPHDSAAANLSDLNRQIAEMFGVPARLQGSLQSSTYASAELAIPLDLGELLADMEQIKAEADDYDAAIDERRRALHLLYGPGDRRPTGLLEESERRSSRGGRSLWINTKRGLRHDV